VNEYPRQILKSSTAPASIECKLAAAVEEFFFSGNRRVPQEILERLRCLETSIYLVGGVARDLAVFGSNAKIRDIDIVVASDVSTERLAQTVREFIKRRTRFGGLQLSDGSIDVDVWPLDQTWAIREKLVVGADLAALANSAFLNIESVVIELTSTGVGEMFCSDAFLTGIANQKVDLHLSASPFPRICALRSLIKVAEIGYSMGSALQHFLMEMRPSLTLDFCNNIQIERYGFVRYPFEQVQLWLTGLSRNQFPLH
jgi:hypothetical protein